MNKPEKCLSCPLYRQNNKEKNEDKEFQCIVRTEAEAELDDAFCDHIKEVFLEAEEEKRK